MIVRRARCKRLKTIIKRVRIIVINPEKYNAQVCDLI